MFYVLVGILLIILDMVTKYVTDGMHIGIINSQINYAAARGFGISQNILIVAAIIIVTVIGRLCWKKQLGGRSTVLLLAGALGNLYDRIALGGVRDWISLGNFPVFNVADICITCGVILFIYEQYRKPCVQH